MRGRRFLFRPPLDDRIGPDLSPAVGFSFFLYYLFIIIIIIIIFFFFCSCGYSFSLSISLPLSLSLSLPFSPSLSLSFSLPFSHVRIYRCTQNNRDFLLYHFACLHHISCITARCRARPRSIYRLWRTRTRPIIICEKYIHAYTHTRNAVFEGVLEDGTLRETRF